jgi:hypothetical protein
MKLRIMITDPSRGIDINGHQLRTLHHSAKLVVQGSDDVMITPLTGGRQAFLAGSLVGIRSKQGEIIPSAHGIEGLKELIGNHSIEKCCDLLEGRFLLVIAGSGDHCSMTVDRYGQFDLYYELSGETKCFASDLSLMPDSPAQNGFDQVGLAHTLCVYGYRPPKRHTLYQGIRRLGTLETIHIKQGQVELSKTPFQPICTSKFGDRELREYSELLLEGIRVRGSQYGNVVYLSSGWDSTSILACLVHLFGNRKVRAVIGRMKYSERSGVINPFEIERAEAVANYFNVRLDVVDFDYREKKGTDLMDRLRPLFKSHHVAGGTSINHAILADFVARTTNGEEMVFAGEISDGVHNLGFSQYLTIFHPVIEFREYSDKMMSYLFGPTFLRLFQNGQFVEDPIYNLFRSRAGNAIFDQPSDGGPMDRTRQLLASFFLRSNRLPLWSLRNNNMLTEKGIHRYTDEMESTYLKEAADSATPETLYSWYLYLYNSFHWQCSTVAPLFLTTEANGLAMALPFWDSRIQEFLSAMPENWGRGLDLNPTKYPLKWMLKNCIDYPMHLTTGPHSYLYDVNPSFSIPAEMLYASGFTPYFKESLQSRAYHDLLSPEAFNMDYIDSIVNRYLEGTEVRGSELRDLIPLCWLSLVGWYGKRC